MGFIDDLKKGLPGLQLSIPDAWKRQEEQDRRCVLVDSEHRVGWHIIHAPWRADLRPESFESHRRDIERHARYAFEQHYHQVPAQKGQPRPPVRTTDPEFAPLISIEHVTVDGVPALLTIRRVAYEPIMEAVVANLLVPLATGMLDITCFQHTQETGYRENNLLTLAMQRAPGEAVQKLARKLGQTHFDDPQFDAQFPTHPLTCVRAAVKWLLALPQDQLKVTNPPAPHLAAGAEVELPQVGCAIVPPPRYVAVPPGVLPLPAGVAVLSRVILEGADDPQMLDVRQVAGVSLPVEKRQEALLEMVQRQIAEWQQQGAQQIQMSWEPVEIASAQAVSGDGPRVAIAVDVNMLINGVPTHTVARWICDNDGRVFRIGVATPPYIPATEAAVDVAAAVKSWRRLPQKTSGAWLTSDLKLAPAKRAELAEQAPAQA
jgi:hypothetical protein